MHGKIGQTYDTIYTKKNCWCILQVKSDDDGSWMTSVAYIILFLWDHWIMMLRKGGIVHRSFWWPHAHTHKSRGLIEVDTKPRTFSSSLMYGRRCLSAHTERDERRRNPFIWCCCLLQLPAIQKPAMRVNGLKDHGRRHRGFFSMTSKLFSMLKNWYRLPCMLREVNKTLVYMIHLLQLRGLF